MRIVLATLLLAAAACDREPAKPAPPASPAGGLAPGRVRVSGSPADPKDFSDPDVTHGVRGTLDYGGPKTRLELVVELWEKGRRVFSPPWVSAPLEPPLNGEFRLGLGTKKGSEGSSLLYVKRVFPAGKPPAAPKQVGEAHQGPLLDPAKTWTLKTLPASEVSDAGEIVIAALVAGNAPTGPLEDVGRSDASAWLFKVRLSHADPANPGAYPKNP